MRPSRRFAHYAWATLAVTLAVVLWGAYVRATGSGAGCGAHWPACNGEVVPRLATAETRIEFTHRITSGTAFLLVLGMLVWARRAYHVGHRVRTGATASMVLMVVEALLGAGLVLAGLVADNPSLLRAVSMAAHLVNTFLLLGAITLTAWWASGGPPIRRAGHGAAGTLLWTAAAGMLLVGISGAIAALGDTLFPARSLAEGFRQDLDPAAHFLLRLRILHPVLAVGFGAYLMFASVAVARHRPDRWTRRLARGVVAAVLVQIGAGFLNLVLLAPVWMQLIHLLLADAVWIALVLFGASALRAPAAETHPISPPPRRRKAAPI